MILIYDQLLFRPLVVWADRFRVEQTASQSTPHSWFLELLRHSHLAQAAAVPASFCLRRLFRARILNIIPTSRPLAIRSRTSRAIDILWYIFVAAAALGIAAIIVRFVARGAGWSDVLTVLRLGTYTLLRVVVLIVLASLIWLPVGVAIGLRPKLAERVQPLAQFLAAFPANLLFPLFVIPIVRFKLNTDIWLTPLMILGTQWYILFNVIAGTTALPTDFLEAADNFRLPRLAMVADRHSAGRFFPITSPARSRPRAAPGTPALSPKSFPGDTTALRARPWRLYRQMTAQGDYPRIVLGIATMSAFVVLFNRLLWRPALCLRRAPVAGWNEEAP